MRKVVELVLRQQLLYGRHILGGDVSNDKVLIGSHPERALMDLGNFMQPTFEFTSRLILDSTILDETGEVMLAILASDPSEIINITVENERTRRL